MNKDLEAVMKNLVQVPLTGTSRSGSRKRTAVSPLSVKLALSFDHRKEIDYAEVDPRVLRGKSSKPVHG